MNTRDGHPRTIHRVPLKSPRRPNHRLTDLRQELGWSPARLGYEAGVTAKSVRDIESGATRNPHAETMRAIASALRVSVRELKGDSARREYA